MTGDAGRKMLNEGPDAAFRRFLAEGRFMIQRSAAAKATVFPPRVMAPGSGETDLEWIPASGRGVVHSFTVVGQKPPAEDYNICLIDLEEGPRLMSRVVGLGAEALAIGLKVEALVDPQGEEPVLLFRPVKADRAA
jgi:uncharacterized OB-fold protein